MTKMTYKNLIKGIILIVFIFLSNKGNCQKNKLIDRDILNVYSDTCLMRIITDSVRGGRILNPDYEYLENIRFEKIYYYSGEEKVNGYIIYPIESGLYPCIIYNRGGNRDFGSITNKFAIKNLAPIASWGYVVIASQYRGSTGATGNDEFGGEELNDILTLLDILPYVKYADTSKIGMYGWSRGGMMTYLALTKTNKIKAAIVGGGLSDLFLMKESRKDSFETIYEELIPDYSTNSEEVLKERSAIHFVESICKTTPILMLHGSADWRVVPQMALNLSSEFIKNEIPHRLIIFEGGDHALSEYKDEVSDEVKKWFQKYLKDEITTPSLKPHGN